MTDVYRVTATWSGFVGAPGYSKFSFNALDSQSLIDAAGTAVRTFFDGIKTLLATNWTVQVAQPIDVFNAQTGVLVNTVNQSTAPAVVQGTAASALYTGGAGAYVRWITPFIFNGRRVQGRTYLVPLINVQQSDGTLASSTITAIQTATAALISGTTADFVIWAKQFSAGPPPVQVNGSLNSVLSAIVPDKTGILRSRRD